MRKLHNKLKASAPKRREGTGRTNPQEGIVDGIVRKKKEAKTYEKLGRAVHAKASRPPVDMPMKDKPFKPAVVGNNDDARGFAGEVAATKPKVTVSERTKTTPAPTVSAPSKPKTNKPASKPAVSAPVSNTRDWGSQGPAPKATPDSSSTGKVLGMNTDSGFVSGSQAQWNKNMNERPRATGAIESKSGHIVDALTLGQVGMIGAGIVAAGYAVKKGTEAVIKAGVRKTMSQQAGRVFAKDAAVSKNTVNLVVDKAREGGFNVMGGRVGGSVFDPKMGKPIGYAIKTATPSAAKAGTSTVVAPAAKATTKAGSETVIAPAAKAGTKKATDMSKLNASAARGEARVTGNSSGNINQKLDDPAFLRRDSYNIVPPPKPASAPKKKTSTKKK